jgi:hypothetical protein
VLYICEANNCGYNCEYPNKSRSIPDSTTIYCRGNPDTQQYNSHGKISTHKLIFCWKFSCYWFYYNISFKPNYWQFSIYFRIGITACVPMIRSCWRSVQWPVQIQRSLIAVITLWFLRKNCLKQRRTLEIIECAAVGNGIRYLQNASQQCYHGAHLFNFTSVWRLKFYCRDELWKLNAAQASGKHLNILQGIQMITCR